MFDIPATCLVVFVIILCFISVVFGVGSTGQWRGGGSFSPVFFYNILFTCMALLHLPLDPRTKIQIYTSYNFTYMFFSSFMVFSVGSPAWGHFSKLGLVWVASCDICRVRCSGCSSGLLWGLYGGSSCGVGEPRNVSWQLS